MASHDSEGQQRRSHGESFWAKHPEIARCTGHNSGSGKRCRFEAILGSSVCAAHGGNAPQVRRRAAARIMNAADRAIEKIIEFMDDEDAPRGVRLKAAQDIADRAALAQAQVIKVIPGEEDPVQAMFTRLLSDSSNLEPSPEVTDGRELTQDRDPEQRAIDAYGDRDIVISGDDYEKTGEVVELRNTSSEPEDASDTPPRIAQMIRDGSFARTPRS
jgi:hypothetical protein